MPEESIECQLGLVPGCFPIMNHALIGQPRFYGHHPFPNLLSEVHLKSQNQIAQRLDSRRRVVFKAPEVNRVTDVDEPVKPHRRHEKLTIYVCSATVSYADLNPRPVLKHVPIPTRFVGSLKCFGQCKVSPFIQVFYFEEIPHCDQNRARIAGIARPLPEWGETPPFVINGEFLRGQTLRKGINHIA